MSEANLPAGCTQAQIDAIFGSPDEIECSEFVKRSGGTHGPCGSQEFHAELTCSGEFELTGEPCRYKYAVPVEWNGERWTSVGSIDCPICGYDDNQYEAANVVCAKCGCEAPTFCSHCLSIPCHCPDDDDREDD